jgi:hypothetical protein
MTKREARPIDPQPPSLLTSAYCIQRVTSWWRLNEKRMREKVRQDLVSGGYEPSECEIASAEFMADAAQRNINSAGLLARLGASIKFVKSHLEAAKRGATFLLIYAPSLLDVERAMRVVRRVPFLLAHRYTRLAIEDLN